MAETAPERSQERTDQRAPAEPEPPLLVDPEVSRAKFDRQLQAWRANAARYRERGWILLAEADLEVEIGFCCRLPITPHNDIVAMPLAVRLGFQNYDVWPPSVELIDPLEGRPLQRPRVGALDFANAVEGVPPQLLVVSHPHTGRVFLCKRGVREYHTHPEHDGDDWLLYRGGAIGGLAQLCELLWRLTIRTISGLDYASHRLRFGDKMQIGQQIGIRQQNLEELEEQARAQAQAQLPPEMLAALQGQPR